MALWLPLGLIAATVLGVVSQRKASSTCANLSPEERATLDRFLVTDPEAILAVARSQKDLDKANVVNAIHESALQLDALGCKTDGDRVRAKAAEVARTPEPPIHATSSTGGNVQQLTGAYVEPQVRVGAAAVPEEGAGIAQPAPHDASPAAPRSPPIALLQTKTRVAVRPEPVPWNDETMGKLGFTVPAGYPVGLLALGPPICPPGWSKIELQHPDHGIVEGFTEASNLAPPSAPSAPATTATKGVASPASFQGRTRRRGQSVKASKRPRPAPAP